MSNNYKYQHADQRKWFNLLVLFLIEHSERLQLSCHTDMLRTVGILTYLQCLLVQLLSVAVLFPLNINSSQLVQGPGYARMVWVQGCLPDLKRPL